MRPGYLLSLSEPVPYGEAFELQRSLAGAVSQGAIPDTVILLEHTPVITMGRRTEVGLELHVPENAEVEIAETDRGGKSTFHGPGQLVCYPILDLKNHGKDVKRYVRDLEDALIRYPVNELALKHRAGVEKETTDAREAYAGFSEDRAVPLPDGFPETPG